MARNLTAEENDVLAHVVVDPAAWWAHAQTATKFSPEKALAEKIAKWKPKYDVEKLAPGYEKRAARQAKADDAHEKRVKAGRP
jgi:hypothetical protein